MDSGKTYEELEEEKEKAKKSLMEFYKPMKPFNQYEPWSEKNKKKDYSEKLSYEN